MANGIRVNKSSEVNSVSYDRSEILSVQFSRFMG